MDACEISIWCVAFPSANDQEGGVFLTMSLTGRGCLGSCVLAVVLMGQAGEIPDKPASPYVDKVGESWTEMYELAQTLWDECELLRAKVGWIRVGE